MTDNKFVPLRSYNKYSPSVMTERAASFRNNMQCRRSVREFSNEPVPREVIEDCILTAGSAPSGANRQPWHFVVVSDHKIKRRIREAAEKEEYDFYHGLAGDEWLKDLSQLETNHEKPFLEEAPCLIVIFGQSWGVLENGDKKKHYYVSKSAGIATGMLIAAIHNAGLVCLPYTPSRMSFLRKLLGRGKNEKPFLVLVVGYPAEDAMVPALEKKTLNLISTFL
ncbi:nitroreductase family protein [Thermodesulfobacteriota bacterium]